MLTSDSALVFLYSAYEETYFNAIINSFYTAPKPSLLDPSVLFTKDSTFRIAGGLSKVMGGMFVDAVVARERQLAFKAK